MLGAGFSTERLALTYAAGRTLAIRDSPRSESIDTDVRRCRCAEKALARLLPAEKASCWNV